METILARLKALYGRLSSAQAFSTCAPSHFEGMRNQFFKEVEVLKQKFPELVDFVPQQYGYGPGNRSYAKFSVQLMMADMKYFIDFLTLNSAVQLPQMSVTEEGMFFSGQHFDALLKINQIISSATSEIVLVDGYVNESLLELLGGKNPVVKVRVLTKKQSLSSTLKGFIQAFNKQHGNLDVRSSEAFHDRFVVIDKSKFYHFGASLKDAGNKGFMFSRIDEDLIKTALWQSIESEWSKHP